MIVICSSYNLDKKSNFIICHKQLTFKKYIFIINNIPKGEVFMYNNTGLYDDIIVCFHQIIKKQLEINHNVYSKDLGTKIANILLENDEQNKLMFFDAFKKVQTDDKRKIINVCLFDIVSKIDIIISNANEIKINEILNYVDENDRHLLINIYDFLNKEHSDGIPKEIIIKLNSLNEYEKLIIGSMCLNVCNFTLDSIKHLLENITSDFYVKPQNHKSEIVELLKFYSTIYDVVKYIDGPKIEDKNSYVKLYPITYNIKLFIQRYNNIARKTLSLKMIIYYIFYEFLINLDFDENSKNYINEVVLMIKNNNLDMDDETFNYLFNFCKDVADCYSLEEKIESIQELKQADISPIINLYASFDIAEYKILQKKKKAFGLK